MSTTGIPDITAYEKGGVKIDFGFEKDPNNPAVVNVKVSSSNSLSVPMTDFVFQAAVPKVGFAIK